MNNLKKRIILVIFIVGALVFIFQPVQANCLELNELKDSKITGQINYNSYDFNGVNDWVNKDYNTGEEISNGVGLNLGVEKKLNYLDIDLLKNVKAGLEVEWLPVSYSEVDIYLSQTGFLITGGYELQGIHSAVPGGIYFKTGLGLSRYRVLDNEVDYGSIDEVYYGTIAKVGIEAEYNLINKVNAGSFINYRYSRPFSEDDINFSGSEFGLKVSYKF